MTSWPSRARHPLFILTLSVLSAVGVAGLAGPWLPAPTYPGADGQAVAALPFSGAPLTPGGESLPVAPVVATKGGLPSTKPGVAVNLTDPRLARASRLKVTTHLVASGETLASIAARYGSDPETLAGLNPELGGRLRPGQRIKVMDGRGSVYVVGEGDTLTTVAKRFYVAKEKLMAANGLLSEQLKQGQTLILPGIKPRRRDDELASRGLGPLYLSWPARGWITSRFGPRWGRQHEGVDIAASWGSRVTAAAPGRVEYTGWYAGYGRLIIVDHGRGIKTWYGHNSRFLVKPGQPVERGDLIAYSGSSGQSTGPHLHFEVRVNGRPQNPLALLRR